MAINTTVRRVFVWIERMMLSTAVMCLVSYLLINILEGVMQFLIILAGEPQWYQSATAVVGLSTNVTEHASSMVVPSDGKVFASLKLAMIVWIFYFFASKANCFFTAIHQLTALIMSKLRDATFVALIRSLYLNGPNLRGFGFWKGKQMQDICTQLYDQDAIFWKKNIDTCKQAIETEVQSLVIGAQMLIAIVLFIKYFNHLWSDISNFGYLGQRFRTPPSSPVKQSVKTKVAQVT
jgi:hypothetical protein